MDKFIIELESILFLKGEPVSVSWLAKTLDKKEEEINISLEQLSKQLENRGIRLVRNGNEVVLATAPESAEILKSIVKSEFDSELSKASLETLPDFVSVSAKLKDFFSAEKKEKMGGV